MRCFETGLRSRPLLSQTQHVAWVAVVGLAILIASPSFGQMPGTDPHGPSEDEPVPSSTTEENVEDQPPSEEDQAEDTSVEDAEPLPTGEARTEDPLDDIEPEPFSLKWDRFSKGLRGLTRYSLFDEKVRFRLGLGVILDGTLGLPSSEFEDAFGDITSTSFDARRFRLFAEGIARRMYFRLEFEFGAEAGFRNVFVQGREGGLAVWGHHLGKFRYGQFLEPFSLERSTGLFDVGLVERSLPVWAFAPGHNIGAMVFDASKNKRITWAVGLFSWGKQNDDNASGSLFSLTTRWTGLPVFRNNGQNLFHLGASFSTRSPTNGSVQYRVRPEARFVGYFVDTGPIESNRNTLVGLEAAWKNGPMWAQAEWINSEVDAPGETLNFSGGYLQVGWYITGESRPYNRDRGVWAREKPEQNYRKGNPFKKKNGGAWQLTGRISTIDLNDGPVEGGRLTDLTVGVTWHLNSVSEFKFNWIHSKLKDVGNANIFVLRFQYHPK